MCKQCSGSRSKSVSGMKLGKGASSVIVTGAKVGVGYGASRLISRASFAQANPIVQVLLPIGGALVARNILGKKGDPIAYGMVAGGLENGVRTYLPSIAQTLGLAPAAVGAVPYRSINSPGVAGMGQPTRVKVRYQ